jgi:hypothetical protein
MPINKRVGSAQEALADVRDGSVVMISGFGGAGFPNFLIRALRDRAPKGLTLIVNSATHRLSYTHELIEAGLVRKIVCSAARGRDKGLQDRTRMPAAGDHGGSDPGRRRGHSCVLHSGRRRHGTDQRQGSSRVQRP